MRFLDRMLHRWRFDWIPADEINAEAGSMDNYCTCRLCRRRNQ